MQYSRIIRYILLLIALSLMLACALPFSLGKKEPDIQRLRVADVDRVDLDSGERVLDGSSAFTPSPDGKKIAVFNPVSVCIYTADGENLGCKEDERKLGRVDPMSVRWSPDGKSILFTEWFFRYMIDADLWLLDVENLSLKNLTDDHVEGDVLTEEDALVDLLPQWIEGGKRIAFVRIRMEEDEPVLCRIDPKQGEVEEGTSLPSKKINDVKFSSDGKQYAFTIREEPYWSVYFGKVDGGSPNLWLEAEHPLYEVAFSADGKYLMIREVIPDKMNLSVVHLLDAKTGEEVQTIEGDRNKIGTMNITKFAWSPAGSAFLYFELDRKEKELRLFAGTPGEEPREIEVWNDYPLGLDTLGKDLSLLVPWSDDNTLLLFNRAEGELVRIYLEEE